jgi:Uma2 family endonuclease
MAMRKPVARATYDDILKLPEHLVGELIDGELFVSPRPALPHAAAASRLGGFSNGFDGPPGDGMGGGPGGWCIVDEPELHFGGDVLVPDLAGWRRERMPKIPKAPYFTMAPDWVCEVASPSTERLDRSKKMRIYAIQKVAHLWLVNPLSQTLESYALDGPTWRLLETFTGTDPVRVIPFDTVPLDIKRLWPEE